MFVIDNKKLVKNAMKICIVFKCCLKLVSSYIKCLSVIIKVSKKCYKIIFYYFFFIIYILVIICIIIVINNHTASNIFNVFYC